MKWTFKSMNFIKSKIEENLYTFEVKIHDLLHTIIVIKKEKHSNCWSVKFKPLNKYEGFNISEEEGLIEYTRYGFKTFEEAKEYAQTEYQLKMSTIVQNIINDLNNYVEVKYDETI